MTETIKSLASAEYLVSRLGEVCDSVKHEKNGNIIGFLKGSDDTSPLMLATHYDLPHFICTGVDGEKVSLVHVENYKVAKWEGCTIVSETGVIATMGDDEDKLYAIIKGENTNVPIGDVFFANDDSRRENGSISSYGISATAPATALLLAAEKLSEDRPLRDVYFAFTAEGQYGYKLYSSAAKKCGVTEAVCIGCIDEKESEKVTVRLCDRSFSSDKKLSDKLISVGAESIAIREGRCAAGMVQLWGIPTAELDLPIKDIGSTDEAAREDDIYKAADIITEFCRR